MKNFLAKTSIPLLCAALMFAGCGMDQEGRGADNGNRAQTYNAGKQGNRNMVDGLRTTNRNNRGNMTQFNNGKGTNRLTTLRGDQPGTLAGAGIMAGNGTRNRTYSGANIGRTRAYGTAGQNRGNQNRFQAQGISSILETQMQQRGMNNVKVLVLGDYVILGQSDRNGGTQAGTLGTSGNRTLGANNGNNGQGMFNTNNNDNNRGLGEWFGDLFDTDNKYTTRRDTTGGMAGRGMVGDTGIVGGGSAYGTDRGNVINGAGYGMAGAGMMNGTTGQQNRGGMATLNDARSLIYQSFGRNVRVLTVSDEKALAAMDRVKNNLNSNSLAQDIQTILSNGTPAGQSNNR